MNTDEVFDMNTDADPAMDKGSAPDTMTAEDTANDATAAKDSTASVSVSQHQEAPHGHYEYHREKFEKNPALETSGESGNSGKINDYSALIAIVMIILGTVSVFLKTSAVEEARGPEKRSKQAIGLIDVSGVIRFTGQTSGFEGVMGYGNGAEAVISKIDSFAEMENVKGLILRIDSPGGTVGAAQEICSAIDRFRNVSKDGKPEKFVIASFGDTAASGAYYIASACDEIFANPGTLTGSIGVVMQGMEFSNLMDKAGVSEVTVKSGKYKDIGSPFRSMTAEEKELLQAMVDDCFDQFVERVSKGRKITKSIVTELGARIMTGRQAKEKGLVDYLGGLDSAIKRAGDLTGLGSSPRVIKAHRSSFDLLFGKLGALSQGRDLEIIKGLTGLDSYIPSGVKSGGLTASYKGLVPNLIADLPAFGASGSIKGKFPSVPKNFSASKPNSEENGNSEENWNSEENGNPEKHGNPEENGRTEQ